MKEQLLNKVENIVTYGEIAHHEQFLLLQQCFQNSSIHQKALICGKGLNKQNETHHV